MRVTRLFLVTTALSCFSTWLAQGAVMISTTSLPGGEVGAVYSQTLAAMGGPAPFTWSIASGALPAGLMLSPAGQISGTPSAAGTAKFTVTVTDSHSDSATQALSINVVAAVTITTTSLPGGQVGIAYSQTLAASGGTPPYTWSIASGALPAGLMLSPAGQISGTPSTAGPANFTVKVTDSNSGSATQALSINVVAAVAITTTSLPGGQVGIAYSQTLAASGGTPPYTWSVSAGALPAGLTLSAAGQISGTPSTAGTANFTVRVTDSNSESATQALSINVTAAVAITTTSLAGGQVGIAYSQTLAATGGTPPYTWSVSTGALPAGLTLSAAGQISGTPSTAGTANFSVKATDSHSESATQALSINVTAAVAITTTSLPGGEVGAAYSQTLAASGGTPPYTWSISTGALPAGLTLSAAGQISGTPSTAGPANFTVKVTDSHSESATQALSINVTAAVAITTTSLPGGEVGAAYSQTLAASGGTPPYTWSIASGSLPAGLSMSSTGQISGTPSAPGVFSFSAGVKDSSSATATAKLAITVSAGVSIGACPAGTGTVGQAYSAALTASGGTPPYTWSINSGQLPAGLTLSPQGQINGTPTAAGTSTFSLRVSDSASVSGAESCSIVINAAVAPLSVTTVSLPDGISGVQYSQTVSATGGQPPYTWTLAGGALPPGLSLATNGLISGAPTTAGQFSFTVHVADTASGAASKDLSIRIDAALAITACPVGSAVVGQAYTGSASATGGVPPYSWSASGSLPAGLALNPSSGSLAGTPTTAGVSAYVLVVSDASSATVNKSCSLNVIAALTVTTSALSNGTSSVPYSQQLSASGGTPPYSWSVSSGSLASGLALSSSGSITGTPAAPGSFSFTVTVADSSGLQAARPLSIVIAAPLVIGCPVGSAVSGQTYSSSASATGGQPPYTWSQASGLPAGISINAAGQLTGTPSTAGTFVYTLSVADKTGATATQQCTLTVASTPTVVTAFVPDASQFSQYSQSLIASGGAPPYNWSVASGALAPGLTLSSTGLIAGSPTQLGSFSFTVQVTDTSGAAAQKSFSMNVFSGLVVTTCPPAVAEVGFAVTGSVAAAGGTPPYNWSVSAGSLPPGLSLDTSSGNMAGTPAQSGTVQFTVMATDNANRTATRACSIQVQPALAVTTSSLATGVTGASYSDTVVATGGVPPYVWSTTAGSLPPGVALNAANGTITGTPAVAGAFGFTAQVTDSLGAQMAKPLTITIAQGLTIPNCPTPVGVVGQQYSAPLAAVGGATPYQWSISSGVLPPGLSFDAADALIAGLPSQVGSSSYTLQVNDATNKTATRSCTIQIQAAQLTITSVLLPEALVGVPYSQTLAATGGQAPYSWSIATAGAPNGFSLDTTGALTGTASTPGIFSFTVQVTDSANNVARQTLTLSVDAGTPPDITVVGLPANIGPAEQPTFSLQVNGVYPIALSGTVTLTFIPDPAVGVDDPAVQFASGGRTLQFTLPANSTTPVFSAPVVALQTGTVAGSIQLSVAIQSNGTNITPAAAPVEAISVNRLAPQIVSLNAVQTSSGVELQVVGFATTRQVTQGLFQFQPAGGGQPVQVAVSLATSAATWFQSSQSLQFGGEFLLVQPFTFQGESLSSFSSVSMTLSNDQGSSASMTVQF